MLPRQCLSRNRSRLVRRTPRAARPRRNASGPSTHQWTLAKLVGEYARHNGVGRPPLTTPLRSRQSHLRGDVRLAVTEDGQCPLDACTHGRCRLADRVVGDRGDSRSRFAADPVVSIADRACTGGAIADGQSTWRRQEDPTGDATAEGPPRRPPIAILWPKSAEGRWKGGPWTSWCCHDMSWMKAQTGPDRSPQCPTSSTSRCSIATRSWIGCSATPRARPRSRPRRCAIGSWRWRSPRLPPTGPIAAGG
jgi:hypothetical protein